METNTKQDPKNQFGGWDCAASQEVAEILSTLLKVPEGALLAHIRAKQEAARRKVANQNARYAAALERMTDVQSVIVEHLQQDGYTMGVIRLCGNRVAPVLQKQFWNQAKGRMGTKLTIVYPDGTRTATFERSISVKGSF